MGIATLCFLIRKTASGINEVCLAMKKRGFGEGKWNAVGGKFDPKIDKSIEEAAKREVFEEIGVKINEPCEKRGEVSFHFISVPEGEDWDQNVHVYVVQQWEGEPKESEEMSPRWFRIDNLPFNEMWVGDESWIPFILEGRCVKADIVFDDGTNVISKNVQIVNGF